MTTLLRIDASIRVDGSVSRALADSAEATWKAEHPDGVVVRRDLGRHPLPGDAWPAVISADLGFAPDADATRADLAAARALAAELSQEIRNADAVLLAVPLYNYGISQHVKTWLDLLMTDRELLAGEVLRDKPVIFTLARGGGYSPGTPKHGWDHATPYLERIFGEVFNMSIRKAVAELTLASVTPGMEPLIDAAKVSEEEAHVEAEKHAALVARSVTGAAA
ncbi:FMN-dependent NADH-azoreductase [Kribbella monticola]|uniref:FMN-dependent NADH-azoreductase n=1 Tax=Kribbella monticola TaxID=2185285 RepID=UPI000DD408AE|nr:NAD(P)H-dependent oxidoreductase [Kribbella monticola]